MTKTLILYTFDEINENVTYFVKNAYFDHPSFTFLFILNGCTEINFPQGVLVLKRNNEGFDFGAWNEGLFTKKFTGDCLYKEYDYFIFINKSTIGPFMPSYVKELWPNIFLNNITEETKLVGPTINTYDAYGVFNYETRHVQSYLFSTDKIGIELLIGNSFFKECGLNDINNKLYAVINYECTMSGIFLKNGYNIKCLQKKWYNTDFRQHIQNEFCPRDMMYNQFFESNDINVYEVVFVKGNRGINQKFFK